MHFDIHDTRIPSSPLALAVNMIVAAFLAELVIMLALPAARTPLVAAFDAFILSVVLLPFFCFFI